MNRSRFSLENRVALITGSVAGLGKAMAKGLAEAGAHVIINGRSEERLHETKRDFEGDNLTVSISRFAVENLSETQKAISEILQAHGKIDILINNVGHRNRRATLEFEDGAMNKILETNVTAPFELVRMVVPGMLKQQWGRIINVSSVAARVAGSGDAIYTASKGGLESLTRSLAAEFGHAGVTVNAISPGFFTTAPNQAMATSPEITDWLKTRTALKRWAEPAELSGAAVFLASDAASYVTGHILVVDGGMTAYM